MRVRSAFVPVACAAVLLFASSSSVRAVNKAGAPGASKRAPGAAATAQVRSSTATQQALVAEARRAGYAVEWDGALAVPNSIRGADLSTRQAFSAGRGLAAIGRGRYAEDAVAVMDNLAGLFRIANAAEEFRVRKTQGDALGFHHVRLQQMYQGLPVVGGEVIVHFDKADAAYEVNGRYVPDLEVGIVPALDAAQALAIAQADLQALNKPVGALDGAVSLVVYAREDPPRLAQALTLTYRDAAGDAGRWRYWIDALDGSILQRFNNIQSIPPPSGSGSAAAITGALLAGESGAVTNFIGWHDSINPYYYLHNTGRVWIVENVAASGYPDANTYAHRTTNDWGTSDRVEISAARNFDVTLNYYRQRHALFSFDGAGAMARANVHQGVNYVNAYWDGHEFYFGDGNNVIANSLAVLDVCGHEFAHAVTEYSADLVYAGESGALNESFSDVMGACVEFFGQADDRVSYPAKHPGLADWLLGEDCWLSSTALRDMRNPANTVTVGAGNQQPTRYQGSYWDPFQEVHQNSGVQNFFFYLLCDGGSGNNDGINYSVTGIGITNAEQVAHRALTVYCTPNTGYRAVRGAWLSAALDLNPAWASAVRAAWDAVGVQSVYLTPAGSAAFTGSEGGPFLPATFVYTITNADNAAVGWGVSHTQTWVSVTPGGGAIPAFGSQAVTVTINSGASGLTGGTYVDLLVFTNSASASTDSRAVTLLVRPPVVLEFDLSTNPGWTTEGQWAYGVPQGLGSDPTAGATGTNVYGYNLAGAYPDDMPVYALTTHALDCSGYENLLLSFSRWLGVESAEYDSATIQISTNGTTWANVWDHAGSSFQDRSWQSFTYSIPQADGHSTVYLRWLMGPTDGSVTYSGWNLDDIRIHGTARDKMRVVPGDGLTSQGYEGGPFAPTNKTYSVINVGSNTLQWTATTTSAWFTVSSPGGSLAAGATATVSVALSPAATTLVPGQYQGAVTFSNATSGFRSSRAVALTVRAIPGEIGVTDSIPPANDLNMPFGDVIIGLSRTERITITNSDALHAIILSRISFGSYIEDFNDGLAQDWSENVDADWNVVSGEYQAQSAFTRWMVSKYGGKSWTDLTAQMTCRRTGDDASSAALLLRATADFDDEVGSAYVFQISVAGSYGIWKQVGGSWSWLQSWTTSPAIQPGVNVLRATAQGSALSFYINGTLVWSGSDSSLAGGLVGVAGYTEGDTTHYFDDVMAGESLPTMATVSPAQAALNAQSFPGGDPRQAPPSTGAVSRAPATVGAQSIISGAYRITNEPASFPYVIPAQSSIWFDVIYTPAATVSNVGKVVIENNDADEPEVRVALSGRGILDYLTISPAAGLVSSGHPGGPFSPTNLAYMLTNSAAVPVTWTATHTQAWVSVSPAGGTLGIGAAQSVTVSLNAAAAALAVGVYQDTVVFSNATTGIRQTRPVTLTVFTSPKIGVTPAAMWVTNKLGASANRVLTVANDASADGSLTFRLTSRGMGQSPLPFDGDAFVSRIQPGHDFTKAAPGEAFVPGELLVRFAAGVTGAARAALLAGLGGGEVRREYRIVPGLALVKLPPATKVEEALARFNGAAGIVYAEPNYTVQAFDTIPNDARFGELWGLHNTGQSGGTVDADIDAPAVWDSQTGSTNVIVCVIDTGIDYNHEDLAANMWRNPGEIPGNAIDDDTNGYVDDVYGINAITGSGNPMDDNDHGTHVSGTIGGLGNNSVGVAGVNWRVSLMAAKFLSSGGSGAIADAVTCVEYATEMGAKVLSNSWGGGGYSQAMKDAIDVAGAAEIAFVAAAGNANSDNDSIPHYPSSYESTNVIAVMSTDRNDLKSSFSSYGQTTVDLAAPGTGILSCKRGGGYVVFSGTSMATPHVAGAAGLLLSVDPFATVAELKQALMSTVDVLFPTRCVSGGRLNLARALDEMSLPWLSFSSTSVTNLPPGGATNIQVGFHAGELAPAIYHGEIVVTCNDLTNPVVRVPVHMTVLRDELVINPATGFASSGIIGGPFTPTGIVYTVSNSGPASVTWSLAHSGTWLATSSGGGTLAPSAVNAVTVTVNAAAASLAVGNYSDTLAFANALSGTIQNRMATLAVLPVPPEVIYAFPLDTNPGWTTEGQWAFGVPQGLGGDPSSGFTGTNVYGYNLAGAYPNSIPVYALTTPALDCSGYTGVSLSFRRWLGVESATYDHATVQVSTDGVNWVTVWDHVGGSFQDTSWQSVSYDISARADNAATLRIRWLMGPMDSSVVYSGWNLDDIQVLGRPIDSLDSLRVRPFTSLSSTGYQGGPFAPSNQVYTLTNTGASNLAWTATCASNWGSVTPGSGTLAAGATTDVTVAINANANALAIGSHTNLAAFSNTVSGAVQTRVFKLAVQGEIAFASPAYTAGEAAGTALIAVRRGGNTNRAVTVDFATSNGTATAGADYVMTTGTLAFAAGQLTNSFAVSILDDALSEKNESVILTLHNPAGGGTLGSPTVAVLTILEDEVVETDLPVNLYDGSGYLWDVWFDGSIDDGSNDAYDGGHMLDGFPYFVECLLGAQGREVIIGPDTSGAVSLTRMIYVPTNQAYARFREVLHNTGGSAVTNLVRLDTDLGSDSGTILVATSDGDTSFETNDNWIVTDDADGTGDPTVLHVIANDSGRQRPSSVSYSTGQIGYEFRVALAPGETKSVMHFGVQNPSRGAATNQAARLVALELGALAGLSAQELAQIVNFSVPPPAIANVAASEVTASSATLNGNLTSTGTASTAVSVYWGTVDRGTNAAGWGYTNRFGTRAVGAVSTNVTGLAQGATYYYRFYASNSAGVAWADPAASFRTLSAPVVDNDGGATNITAGGARLRGTLTAGGNATVTIYWGTVDGGTNPPAWQHTNSLGTASEGAFFSDISGLDWSTTYRYRCYAANAYGTDWADSTATFQTPGKPFDAWARRLKITFSGYTRAGALANFPVLVMLHEGLSGFRYSDFATAGGGDLRFTDANHTEIPYQIEKWNPGGTSYVWVKVPQLANSAAYLWAYWGKSGAAAPAYCADGSTWTEGFAGVWHLSEGGTGTRYDSTANVNHGAPQGYNGEEACTGMVDGADDFDGATNTILIANAASLNPTEALSCSAWIKAGRWDQDNVIIRKESDYRFYNRFDGTNRSYMTLKLQGIAEVNYDIGNLATGVWYHVVGTYNRSSLALYVNGVSVASKPLSAAIHTSTDPVYIGAKQGNTYWFRGIIDEARICRAARSADWVWACYSNQVAGSTFCAYGPVTDTTLADADGDGMDDNWEIHYLGGTNAALGGAMQDRDGDGFCNLFEFYAGTDPTNAASLLEVSDLPAGAPTDFIIRWASVAGKVYDIRWLANLFTPPWATVASNLPATPPLNVHTVGVTGAKSGFYRVDVQH